LHFHRAVNHGAVLQGLALAGAVESLGAAATIIDYRPRTYEEQYAPLPGPVKQAAWVYHSRQSCGAGSAQAAYAVARRMATLALELPQITDRKAIRAAFDRYLEAHARLTRPYGSIGALQAAPPALDAYVVGSDQVWNPYVTGGLDPAFFLGFGAPQTNRVAYAVSPTRQLNVAAHAAVLKALTSGFSHISLREAEQQAALAGAIGHPVAVSPDPVLLLEPGQLAALEEPIKTPSRPYLLTYLFRDPAAKPAVEQACATLAKAEGLGVIDVSLENHRMRLPGIHPRQQNPGEFLSLLKGAALVVTNSFHATALSVLYGRRLLVATRQGTGGRMVELLERLGLGGCLMDPPAAGQPTPGATRVEGSDQVEARLAQVRAEGMDYLKRSLGA
jgi:hypothetical protein